jgi:hypothetical protein
VLGLLEVVGKAVERATIVRRGKRPAVVAELHCPRLTLPTLQVFCQLLDGSGADGRNVMLETVNTAEAFTGEMHHGGCWMGEGPGQRSTVKGQR